MGKLVAEVLEDIAFVVVTALEHFLPEVVQVDVFLSRAQLGQVDIVFHSLVLVCLCVLVALLPQNLPVVSLGLPNGSYLEVLLPEVVQAGSRRHEVVRAQFQDHP